MTARSPAPGSANPDPVGELRFKVSLPSGSLGSFREVSGIGVEVETMDYAEGGNNEVIGKMKVSALLESLPGVGKVRARQIMERIGISETRRVRGLGANQTSALQREFGGSA